MRPEKLPRINTNLPLLLVVIIAASRLAVLLLTDPLKFS